MAKRTRAVVQTGPRRLEMRDLPVPEIDVERRTLEIPDALRPGQLGAVEGAVREHDEAGADVIAAIGRDDPATAVVVPAQLLHLRLEAGIFVEPEVRSDALRVRGTGRSRRAADACPALRGTSRAGPRPRSPGRCLPPWARVLS